MKNIWEWLKSKFRNKGNVDSTLEAKFRVLFEAMENEIKFAEPEEFPADFVAAMQADFDRLKAAIDEGHFSDELYREITRTN